MPDRPSRATLRRAPVLLYLVVGCIALGLCAPPPACASERRGTPAVKAVERASPSVVNINGEKLIGLMADELSPYEADQPVNGMGTGVVIDSRGYLITNHHVVEGVQRIRVTMADGVVYTARLISHDAETDLAVIQIHPSSPLKAISIGTSDDLMQAEDVIAIGNAFGYEHTVTLGIISALHRTVQVGESQKYEDLIQTDASINPGNSGGPLLNIDGEMIGINVAVRVGAQNIGFAIPVDKVVQVAADLLSTKRLGRSWHGVAVRSQPQSLGRGVVVESIDDESPAAKTGLRKGDVIKVADGKPIIRALDLELALLDRKPGNTVELSVERDSRNMKLELLLVSVPRRLRPVSNPVWELLGLRLERTAPRQLQRYRSRYHGGLTVLAVRSESPAAQQGIRRGDILVGMHIWETVSPENIDYVLNRPDFDDFQPLKFYILRGRETLFGHMTVSAAQRR